MIILFILVLIIIAFILSVRRAPLWVWTLFLLLTSFGLWNEYVKEDLFFFLILFSISLLITFVFIFFAISPIRKLLFTTPIFKAIRKQKSGISTIEKQALTAGNAGFEKGLFSGRPDWDQLRSLPPLKLNKEELNVLNGPVEELCKITNDWDIRYKKHEIPESIWKFAIDKKLFALRVPKKRGGFGLSFQAQSLCLGKIGSRSVDVATLIELPTSLWPDEIVEKYGTKKQKEYYMPRFSDNKEIMSFAITGISNGSDATAMRDVGVVEYGMYEGEKVLGVRLNWRKRYITFAPKATLLVLAFQLLDPDNLLKKGRDVGISLALISTATKGIGIGRRHLPSNLAFPHGPITGTDVFIPIDSIIGGKERAGEGWKMIMESLFVGRAIALPSISVAAVKLSLRYSAQYARIRRQFGTYIGKFEGIEEPLTRLIETAYITESARAITTAMVDMGDRPLAVSSVMKYKATEYARQAVNDAMDIHAGRAVCDGPSNYLFSSYLASPVGVTVEGANIVTRSIITFAQGILQTHPYLYDELDCCEEKDLTVGVKRFDKALTGHISFFVSNVCRAFGHNLTGGVFGKAPKDVPPQVAKWYKELWKASTSFSYITDITVLFMGVRLKKKQKLGGRLADALSELFFLSSVLKRFEDDGFPESDYPIVELCMKNGMYRFQEAMKGAVSNFPVNSVRFLLSSIIFPFGAHKVSASDELGHQVSQLVLKPGDVLERLSRYIYISDDPEDITGRLEIAFTKSVEFEEAQKKLDAAIHSGKIERLYGVDWIGDAKKQGILTEGRGG